MDIAVRTIGEIVLNEAGALIERSGGPVEFEFRADAYPYVFTACAMAGAAF